MGDSDQQQCTLSPDIAECDWTSFLSTQAGSEYVKCLLNSGLCTKTSSAVFGVNIECDFYPLHQTWIHDPSK